jgi:uncharacterized membrane-anchored protein YhcB (DUF1043 family)
MGSFMPMPFGLAGLVMGIVALVLVSNQKRDIEALKDELKELKETLRKK